MGAGVAAPAQLQHHAALPGGEHQLRLQLLRRGLNDPGGDGGALAVHTVQRKNDAAGGHCGVHGQIGGPGGEKIAVLPQGGGSGGERIGQIWVHLPQQGHDPVPQQVAGGVVRVGVGGVLHEGDALLGGVGLNECAGHVQEGPH